MSMNRFVGLAAVIIAMLGVPCSASADIFGFGCISGNNPIDCAILESQMSMEVKTNSSDPTMVDFLFKNSGPSASSITNVYFSDLLPPLLGDPSSILNSAGVKYSPGCSPNDLAAGQNHGFTTSYCADSDPKVQPNGVNPTEWVQLSYTLQDPATLAFVLAAIADGSFRVGIKVQGYDGEGSETGLVRVAEPGTLLMLGAGFGILLPGFRRARRA